MGRRAKGMLLQTPTGLYYGKIVINKELRKAYFNTHNKREAEPQFNRWRDEQLIPTKRARLAITIDQLNSLDQHAEQITALRNRVPLANAWERFPLDQTTRRRSQRSITTQNVKARQSYWRRFVEWMRDTHPEAEFMEQVTPAIAMEFSHHLQKKGQGGHSHNVWFQTLVGIYKKAGKENPFIVVSPRDGQPISREPLTEKELSDVLMAPTEKELRMLLFIGTYTGLRLQDAARLTWEQIDQSNPSEWSIGKRTAKTGQLVFPPVVSSLRRLLEQVPQEDRKGFVMPGMATKHMKDPSSVSKLVSHHFTACGLSTKGTTEHRLKAASLRGFHCLRATLATIATQKGRPIEEIAALLGHGAAVTRAHYAHHSTQTGKAVVSTLPDIDPTPSEQPDNSGVLPPKKIHSIT